MAASARVQLFRFASVGLLANLVLYGAYLIVTALGVAPKMAMSVLYITGVLSTFVLNGRWTFGLRRLEASALSRYFVAHGLGFGLNLLLLLVMVDLWLWPHQFVQAIAIVAVACLLFALNRYWVFATPVRPEA
jgi:putative flippase GtrA